jgi:dipeptidyl aminopeptidase/acylaminoacyl peptidase
VQKEYLAMVPQQLTLPDDFWCTYPPVLLALSPNGRQLAFTTHSATKTNEQRGALYLLTLPEDTTAPSEVRLLAEDVVPDAVLSWHPTSQHILFVSIAEAGRTELCALTLEDDTFQFLATTDYTVHEAAWSPDGQQIALLATSLSEGPHGVNQVYLLPFQPEGEDATAMRPLRQLTHTPQPYRQLTWTPDGKEIGVVGQPEHASDSATNVTDLFALQPETGAIRCLTEHYLAIDSYAWAPDGQMAMLVATQDRTLSGSQVPQLYLVTRYGNEGDHTLAVSPDLGYAAYTRPQEPLAAPGPYTPQWDTTGQKLYFLVNEQEGSTVIYCLDVVWRTRTRLYAANGLISFLALVPHHEQLVFVQSAPEGSTGLYALSLAE